MVPALETPYPEEDTSTMSRSGVSVEVIQLNTNSNHGAHSICEAPC